MATIREPEAKGINMSWVLKHGIIGGIITGIIFAMAEMLGAYFIAGNPFVMPLKAIASVPLGSPPPEIATSTAIVVGLLTHVILAAIYGVVFAFIVASVEALRTSAMALIVAASIYGLLLWLVNFYVLASAIGRPWFEDTNALQQFVYHTFFFGTVLGLYLASVRDTFDDAR